MNKKELRVILDGIRHVQCIFENYGFANYPFEITMGDDLKKMYYDLNSMAIVLIDKIHNNPNNQ